MPGLRYSLSNALLNRRYGQRKPHGSLQTPGAITGIQPHERGITLTAERGALRLTIIAPDCIQVRFQPSGKFQVPFSYAVAKVTWPEVKFTVSETDRDITLSTQEISCTIERSSSRIAFTNVQGQVFSRDVQPVSWRENEVLLSRELPPDELCLGLGSQFAGLNLRGKRYVTWNADIAERRKGQAQSTIPFYLGVTASYACGISWDNSSRGWIDVGAEQRDRLTFQTTQGELRYYVFSGQDVMDVLNRYTELTGRMPMPPMWALGFHFTVSDPADEVRKTADAFRESQFPCDALYLDGSYTENQRAFSWDRERFPAPAVLIRELAEQGFKTVAVVDPAIKADSGYKVYESGVSENIFLKMPDGQPFVAPDRIGQSAFPDFTSAKARAWWAAQCEALLKAGLAGLANDRNLPLVSNDALPDYVQHDLEGQGADHADAHNVYGMLMARASREALEKYRPTKRPFSVSESGSAGAQRFGAAWVGGRGAVWDELRRVIPMVVNMGLSGVAFSGPDMGGFDDVVEPEFYTRWMQLSAMMPYFHLRTSAELKEWDPWIFGSPYEDAVRGAINLRYQLLPYLYSLFAQSAIYGWPIVRPLFTADLADKELRTVEDAFLVGESLLVAPVLEKGQTERDVYLPRGRWFDFHTNAPIQGGQTIRAKAPLNVMPMYAREGCVIPQWPIQQFVGQVAIDELHLRIYAGNGEVTLYEDAGEGMEYANGSYRWLYFTCKMLSAGGLSIDWRRAGSYKPPYQRVRCEVFGVQFEPKAVQLDGSAAPLWYYEKGVVEFTANQPFDSARIIIPDIDHPAESTLMHSPFKDR